jgi:hypothetical protein
MRCTARLRGPRRATRECREWNRGIGKDEMVARRILMLAFSVAILIWIQAMSIIGTVESLWRYPVKSMRGEELDEIFAGYAGVYGDRHFAFKSSASPKGFRYFTGREQRQMLQYRPRFRHPDKAARPINLTEAEGMPPGANPVSATPAELMVDVETPDGKTLAIDDSVLIEMLREANRPQTSA